MLASLSGQTPSPPLAASPGPALKTHAVASTPATTPPSTAGTTPGVTIHISQEARAAAASEPEGVQQTPSSSSCTVRSVLETAATGALHAAYLTEIFLGYTTDNPRFFTKAEYVEQYDVGAVLGYVRDALREPAEIQTPSTAGPGWVDAVRNETSNKIERWIDRLRGPKTEYIEYVAGAAALAYVVARIVSAQRSDKI